MKKIYVLGLVLLVVAIFAVTAVPGIQMASQVQGLNYMSDVCIYKNNDLVGCSHNVLYDTGAELIEQHLGNEAAADATDWIELCNATTSACETPTAGKAEAYDEITQCGLQAQQGTYASIGNGNWTVSAVFTSTCDNVLTNVTRLRNNAGDDLAGNDFSLVTLQSSDIINVTWTIWVT